MFKLDNDFLTSMGLGGLPVDEKNKLLQAIYERLEMNVGMRLAEKMTDQQLDEFEGFIDRNDEAGALRWLESNFPNYKQVVAEELEKLKNEVSQSAPQILAAAQSSPVPISGGPQSGTPAQQAPPQQPFQGMPATGQPQQPAQPYYQTSPTPQSFQQQSPVQGYQQSQPSQPYQQPMPQDLPGQDAAATQGFGPSAQPFAPNPWQKNTQGTFSSPQQPLQQPGTPSQQPPSEASDSSQPPASFPPAQ